MRKSDTLKKLLITAILFFSVVLPVSASDISVPLTVHEALRSGVSGIDRLAEPVTVGIPFPMGMLHEKNGIPQLSLEGTDSYQFRTLAKWPDGSVRWALIDFETDLKKAGLNKGIKIIRGNGNSEGRLAEDKGREIIVNTGVMTVRIKKEGFNLFDSVTIDGKEIISKGDSKGIVITDGEGKEYLSLNDTKAKIYIEENGPVRAVIKAVGTHISDGKRMMDYTVRMHFYKKKSRVKVVYTLRNASNKQFEHTYIRSLNLITRLAESYEPVVVMAKHNGTINEHLKGEGKEIGYYQAVSDFPQVYSGNSFYYHAPIPPDYRREKQHGFLQEGYWIKKGGDILAKGGIKEYPDLAFIDVSNADGTGMTAGVRFAAGWWPKSLRAKDDGTVSVGLWPEENQVGYWIRYGSHNTFEIMYDFHAKQTDGAVSMKQFQYPPIARAPVDWYNMNVKGISPMYHFVSFRDEKEYVKERGWEYAIGDREPRMKIWRYHYWGEGGFLNQYDFSQISLINFLRQTDNLTSAGSSFLMAESRTNYNADWSIFHSDNYDLSAQGKGKWRIDSPQKDADKAELAKVVFEWEHPHWYGMPLYYYVTGDERIKEAVLDWAEYVKETHSNITMGPYPRVWGWGMYTLAAMYDFTGDKSFMDMADENFKWLLQQRLDPQKPWSTLFIDWDRGYIAGGSGSGWDSEPGIKPGLMIGYVIFDGLYNYYLHMDDKNPLKDKVFDVLEGLSDFMYREPYVEGVKREHWAFWLPYIYNLNDKSKSNHEYRLLKMALNVNLAPYLLNGDDKWLERMDKIIRMAAWDRDGVWAGYGFIDHPGVQGILYQRLHPRKHTSAPMPVEDLTATVNSGKVTLGWTVPEDAVRYQIKYSTKKMAESLRFNPDTRAYKYDPAEYANWWAGENVNNEPQPLSSGAKQSFVIDGLKPGSYYFAIRSWDGFNNRSKISNLIKVNIN